jgi:hypothetical protein
MTHSVSMEDRRFIADLEGGRIEPDHFDHRSHIRAGYIYLAESSPDQAAVRLRDALLAFLHRHGVNSSKYHETITKAWILAIRHFMEMTPATESADAFIDANPRLLDSKIMLTHYSAELLFSSSARVAFVAPDLGEIPAHE